MGTPIKYRNPKTPLLRRGWGRLFLLLFCGFNSFAAKTVAPKVQAVPPITRAADGRLSYTKDSQGNRIPDFSYCGYLASELGIPTVAVKVIVPAKEGDATIRIQSALDFVASLPMDKDGFRGAVLLGKGVHSVSGGLKLNASGVVLRGSGTDQTVLLASGTDRRTLIRVLGKNDKKRSPEIKISDAYVPVNAMSFHVAEISGFKIGDQIQIRRPSTQNWIDTLKCRSFGGGLSSLGWKPGRQDIFWNRKITRISGNEIWIDVPLTTALDTTFGGGFVAAFTRPGQIRQLGIENMLIRSEYDLSNPKDEDHSWMAIGMENVSDAWVRQVKFEHFAGSAVALYETAQRITVEDCQSFAPVSEIGGQRRNTFFTSGQQTLFQRCYAEYGYHDFGVGALAAGPNAFVECESKLPYSFSGTLDNWASGVLFDIVNVDGQALSYLNRGQDGMGAGWTAANSVFWQCSAARVDCYRPPTANNWAFGIWAQFSGDGYWHDSNNHIRPRSLFYGQLNDRLGKNTDAQSRLFPIGNEASSSPSIEVAAQLTKEAAQPLMLLTEWIDLAAKQNPISIQAGNAKTIDQIGIQIEKTPEKTPEMKLVNGWLVRGNTILSGRKHSVPWWNTNPIPAVTRFVPGRESSTTTDNLDELTNWMKAENIVSLEQNYGLWYDRRRDDHERIRRMDGDVWAPFYELPFARSGKETAWDGLSKYDLTKYNPWYWSRLKQFADLADQKGLVLVNQHYFQHNIIEAGAHYADFPWRPANNINNTGFPEPVPYAGDKRIFMAEQFYDENHPVRRPLHEAFIRKNLENFNANSGVIQYISEEFTGPFHFVKFWLKTIRNWEAETGTDSFIGLAVTKDVQDSVLANPELAGIVELIDIRYWFYREDGSAYAPAGGQNLAPRQHARLVKPGKTSFEQVYRAVHEYKTKFPEKAVTYSYGNYDEFGWAVLMAGGSLPVLPEIQAAGFLKSASGMVSSGGSNGLYKLRNSRGECIVYAENQSKIELDLSKFQGKYKLTRINPRNGSVLDQPQTITGGKINSVTLDSSSPVVVWISKMDN